MLDCTLGAPDDAGGGSGWVQPCMSPVALVSIPKLAVNLAVLLTTRKQKGSTQSGLQYFGMGNMGASGLTWWRSPGCGSRRRISCLRNS